MRPDAVVGRRVVRERLGAGGGDGTRAGVGPGQDASSVRPGQTMLNASYLARPSSIAVLSCCSRPLSS